MGINTECLLCPVCGRETLDNIREDMEEIKQEVQQVVSRPIKWWDKIVAAAVGACASGIVAAILATILK